MSGGNTTTEMSALRAGLVSLASVLCVRGRGGGDKGRE